MNKFARKLRDAVWWVKYRTTHRYHIIDISKEMGYKGWIDRDQAMYLACFKILRDFVEQEDPKIGLRSEQDYIDPEWPPGEEELKSIREQLARHAEIRELYNWWTVHRPAEAERISRLMDKVSCPYRESPEFREYCVASDAFEAKDEEMLLRLMKVRQSLWT